MRLYLILIVFSFLLLRVNSQVSLTTAPYFQDFGTTDITSWTNNSTYSGWYNTGFFSGHENVTTSPVPSNNGGFYTYECNSDNNQKIGTRPSNSAPGAVGTYLRYGVILTNNSGSTIQSFRITYRGYQMSLAGNGSVANLLEFHYCIGNPVNTNLVTGTYVSVPSLNFNALQSSASTSSGAQLAGYPCTETSLLTACIVANIPNGQQICLRWSDQNNSNNDPHFAIDDVYFEFDVTTTTCAVILPVELSKFWINENNESEIKWKTETERNTNYFELEKSSDGISFSSIGVLSAKNSLSGYEYSLQDQSRNHMVNYYRLKVVDFDGNTNYSYVLTRLSKNYFNQWYTINEGFLTFYNSKTEIATQLEIINLLGNTVYSKVVEPEVTENKLNVSNFKSGIYIARFTNGQKTETIKFIIP